MSVLFSDLVFVDRAEVAESIESLSQGHDFENQELMNRVDRFAQYALLRLPIRVLDLEGRVFDPSLIVHYALEFQKTRSCPRIVVDGVDGLIIDGFCRVRALALVGEQEIDAYVGLAQRINPYWEPLGDVNFDIEISSHQDSEDYI